MIASSTSSIPPEYPGSSDSTDSENSQFSKKGKVAALRNVIHNQLEMKTPTGPKFQRKPDWDPETPSWAKNVKVYEPNCFIDPRMDNNMGKVLDGPVDPSKYFQGVPPPSYNIVKSGIAPPPSTTVSTHPTVSEQPSKPPPPPTKPQLNNSQFRPPHPPQKPSPSYKIPYDVSMDPRFNPHPPDDIDDSASIISSCISTFGESSEVAGFSAAGEQRHLYEQYKKQLMEDIGEWKDDRETPNFKKFNNQEPMQFKWLDLENSHDLVKSKSPAPYSTSSIGHYGTIRRRHKPVKIDFDSEDPQPKEQLTPSPKSPPKKAEVSPIFKNFEHNHDLVGIADTPGIKKDQNVNFYSVLSGNLSENNERYKNKPEVKPAAVQNDYRDNSERYPPKVEVKPGNVQNDYRENHELYQNQPQTGVNAQNDYRENHERYQNQNQPQIEIKPANVQNDYRDKSTPSENSSRSGTQDRTVISTGFDVNKNDPSPISNSANQVVRNVQNDRNVNYLSNFNNENLQISNPTYRNDTADQNIMYSSFEGNKIEPHQPSTPSEHSNRNSNFFSNFDANQKENHQHDSYSNKNGPFERSSDMISSFDGSRSETLQPSSSPSFKNPAATIFHDFEENTTKSIPHEPVTSQVTPKNPQNGSVIQQRFEKPSYQQQQPEKEEKKVIKEDFLSSDIPSLQSHVDILNSMLNEFGSPVPQQELIATVIHRFEPRSSRELALERGDTVRLIREIDENWLEGERRGKYGIFPASYVQIGKNDDRGTVASGGGSGAPKEDGKKMKAVYAFVAQNDFELNLRKGEIVTCLRKIDANWMEGTNNIGLVGIFPLSYVEPVQDQIIIPNRPKTPKINDEPRSFTRENNNRVQFDLPNLEPKIEKEKEKPREDPFYSNPPYHPPNPSTCVPKNSEVYRAVYSYQPQKSDELQLLTNDIIFVVEKCDDGWFIGTSLRTGDFGIFPGNYVIRH